MSEQEKTVKVDGTEVKVKPSEGRRRMGYHCQECNQSFPSYLDLEAHQRIDHIKRVASA